jgi:hypothetical protein
MLRQALPLMYMSSDVSFVYPPAGASADLMSSSCRVSEESLDSSSQAYGFMHFQLKNRVTNPSLTLLR